jgi:hypothetical protein
MPPIALLDTALTATVERLIAETGIKHNAWYDLFRGGDVDSLVVGGRRLGVCQSVRDYIERQRLGLERDPAEKQAAAEAYARSLSHVGARGAAKARAGLREKQLAEKRRRPTRDPLARRALAEV